MHCSWVGSRGAGGGSSAADEEAAKLLLMRIFWRIHVLLHAPFDEELVLLPLLRRQAGSSCRGPSHAQVESLRFHLELQSRSWQTNSSAWLLTICREAKSSSGCRVRTPTIRSLVSPLTSQHLEGYRIFFLLQAGPAAVALQYRQRSATEEEDHLQGQRLSRSSLVDDFDHLGCHAAIVAIVCQVTLASGSLTGLPHVHAQMGLPLDFVRHVSCPSFYRHSAVWRRSVVLEGEHSHLILPEDMARTASLRLTLCNDWLKNWKTRFSLRVPTRPLTSHWQHSAACCGHHSPGSSLLC